MSIKTLKLAVSPGYPRTFVEINTLDAAGRDVGYPGVLADGKQYTPSFDLVWDGADGSHQETKVFGTGGTEPLYGGKKRDEKDPRVTDPDPGTGPNPGYSLEAPEGFNVGSSAWFYDLGFRFALNTKNAADGTLSIKGHVEGIGSTQGLGLVVKGGKVVDVTKD